MITISKGILQHNIDITFNDVIINKLANDHYTPSYIDNDIVEYYSCFVGEMYVGCFVCFSNYYNEIEIHSFLLKSAIRHERAFFAKMLDIAFIDYMRVTTKIEDRIKTTQNLVRKLGFKHEGTLRQVYSYNNQYGNVELYGILKHEWRN